MSSFDNLLGRLSIISEAKVSPYAAAHPAFGPVTSKMRAGGLSSAPLDTIKFIRDTLYYMDILNDQEFDAIKKAPGFTGKKQAMLAALKAKQDVINQRKDEIAARIEDTLDDFIGGIGVNRSREEKYAAQAAANEIAKEVRKAKSGKKLDDALMDTINMDTILVKASVAKILGEIQTNLGEPGFDIDPDALEEVVGYAENIDTLAKLKSFIKQISNEPGYEIIAAYLSSAVKPIEKGAEDEEMVEDEEGDGDVEAEYYPGVTDEDREEASKPWPGEDGESKVVRVGGNTNNYTVKYGPGGEVVNVISSEKGAHVDVGLVNKYLDRGFPLIRACAAATSFPDDTDTGNEDLMMLGAEDEEGYRVIGVTTSGEKFKSGILPNKKAADDKHWKMTQATDKRGKKIYKSIEVVKGAAAGNEDSKMLGTEDEEYDPEKADLDKDGVDEEWEKRIAKKRGFKVTKESYTALYISDEAKKIQKGNTVNESVTFKERMKPKTSWQLQELRNYGL